jgi:hypothetical protein
VNDAAGAVGDLAEPDDLVVLRGQPGEGLAAEVGKFRDLLVRLRDPLSEMGISPRRSRSIAARTRSWFSARCAAIRGKPRDRCHALPWPLGLRGVRRIAVSVAPDEELGSGLRPSGLKVEVFGGAPTGDPLLGVLSARP